MVEVFPEDFVQISRPKVRALAAVDRWTLSEQKRALIRAGSFSLSLSLVSFRFRKFLFPSRV